MEINVGEYVRTKCGIAKLNRIDNGYQYFLDSDIYDEDTLENTCVTYTKYIIKHSKDIIDLIEVGDYVNGSKVLIININKEKNTWAIVLDNEKTILSNDLKTMYPIKSIVTHNQFDEMKYEVKE